MYPELDAIFISKPDREIEPLPSISGLKKYWTDVNSSLLEKVCPSLAARVAATSHGHDR
jgi:hypothetical protein